MSMTNEITEVLRAHALWRGDNDEYHCGSMEKWPVVDHYGCDWTGDWKDHPAHVAEKIAELFTEESNSYYNHAEPYSAAYERRWVSDWITDA
jgi:hypothetical protein